jgi:glucose 1-dehydrogenase
VIAAGTRELIPYVRIGKPDEIGRATVWLASDDADYVHGITMAA